MQGYGGPAQPSSPIGDALNAGFRYLEEERRLLYVAMTRAKDDLHLLVPQRFFVHGQASKRDRHLYASRTRFITESLLPNFAGVAWPVVRPGASGSCSTNQKSQIDIQAHMRRMWR